MTEHVEVTSVSFNVIVDRLYLLLWDDLALLLNEQPFSRFPDQAVARHCTTQSWANPLIPVSVGGFSRQIWIRIPISQVLLGIG